MLFVFNPKKPVLEIVEVLHRHKVPFGDVDMVLDIVRRTVDSLSVPDLAEDRNRKQFEATTNE